MYYISRISGTAALAALGIAVWFSIVLARADFYFRQATPASVDRAVEIAPRNTEYLQLRALQVDYDGGDSRALTERIARLNPDSSAPRIKLGLADEVNGDSAGAERWLLDAANVDHQFEPRWTLANFYFRAGNRKEEFWKWMRAALEVSYGDRTPAFDLCWRVSANADEILRRAIPDRHEVTGAYLVYLSQTKHWDGMRAVARRLAAYRDPADLPLLYGACDELLEDGDPAAIDVWLLTGHTMPSEIFNGDFATSPLNHGFDWRLVESPGVTHVNLDAPSGHRIRLNGQEPESCSLLRQWLSLTAGKRYRLQWEARTAGIKSPSGLEWRIGDQIAGLSPGEDWVAGEVTFAAMSATAPGGRGSVSGLRQQGTFFSVLELVYRRPVGQARIEGNVELRRIRLTEVVP